MTRSHTDAADVHTTGKHTGHGHDVLASLFFAGRRHRIYTRLAALSGAHPGDRVLDIGCGDGYFTRLMAQAVTPVGTSHGVDPSAAAIGRARAINRLTNCTFSEGVAQSLDATDASYDVVVSSLMIHHLPEPVRPEAVGEMFRVLAPGGKLLIAEFRPPVNRIGRRLITPVTSPAMQHNPIHLLEPLVRDAGFQQVQSGDLRPWIRYIQAVKDPEDQ
jgi:ubiquinone/menaquinone biosynthesis C-methylase UbiE